jgi:glycolate oxidase
MVLTYSSLTTSIFQRLHEIVGKENVVDLKENPTENVFDYAPLAKQFKKIYRPLAIVRPGTTNEVSQILALAQSERVPIIPRSGQTSLSSSVVAKFGGIQIDMKRMNKILEVNTERMYVVTQPGITNFELDEHLRKFGFIYPHDPGSATYSTVGGSLSTSGAGQLSYRYGALTDQTIQIEVVIPGGKVMRLGQGTGHAKVAKASTCYDLKSLFIGSFGTLGIITEAIIKIYPKPQVQYNLLFAYDSFEQAIRVCDILRKANLPCVSQILAFNSHSLLIRSLVWLSQHPNENVEFPSISAGVWVLIAGDEEISEIVKRRVRKLCTEQWKGEELSEYVGEMFYETRHLPSYDNEGPRGFDPDYGVPADAETVIRAKNEQARIFKKFNVDQILDECWYFELTTMHNTSPYYVDESNDESVKKHAQVYTELCRMALDLDGSITGGHGPCFSKFLEFSPSFLDLMRRECGETMSLAAQIKKIIDPNNIMNPGMMALDQVGEISPQKSAS